MKKEDFKKFDLFVIIAVLFLLVFLFIKPSIVGFAVYTPSYYNWTFDNSNDYIYDENLILIENNSARLKLQDEEYSWIEINVSEIYVEKAYYNNYDVTPKVESLDYSQQIVIGILNKVLDVVFKEKVKNGDVISLYLRYIDKTNVYLCNNSVNCEGDYGSVYFPNVEGWYNITVSNLEYERSDLAIATDNIIRVDYLKIIREIEEEHSEINLTYPESASLETNNFDLPNVNQLNLFSKNEELNGQEINYYYYSDGGDWNEIPENGSLPELEQIKIKAELNSDGSNTPILHNMILTYEYCEENWQCSEWSACSENGTRIRGCSDINECGSFENKPIEIENCTYFPGYYDINESKIISLKVNENTIVNSSDLILDLISEEDIIDVDVHIEKNLENLTGFGGKELVKSVNISIGDLNLKKGIIKIYYDNIGNLDENSLKIYYYKNNIWEELNSSINKEEKYVYASVEHFSIYGVFGEEKQSSSSSPGGSSGGGGGSSFTRGSSAEESVEQSEESKVEERLEIPEPESIEIFEEKSPSQSFTGLVVYNAKKAKVSVPIGLGILVFIIAFFVKVGKFKRKMNSI